MSPGTVTLMYSVWCDPSHSTGTWTTAKCFSQLKLLRGNHRDSSGDWPSSGIAFKGGNIIWDKTLYVTGRPSGVTLALVHAIWQCPDLLENKSSSRCMSCLYYAMCIMEKWHGRASKEGTAFGAPSYQELSFGPLPDSKLHFYLATYGAATCLKANPFLSHSQHQHQLLGLSTLFPEKYFLLTFIICHRAKSSRSEQESEWKRAPFATLRHYILIRQVDKASPPSHTIRLEVEVKTTCSVLLFVDDLSVEMLIFPLVSWSVNRE